MSLKIRRCSEDEIRDVVEKLWIDLAQERENDHRYNELAAEGVIQSAVEHKQGLVNEDDSAIYLAKKDGELVGYILFSVSDRPPVFKIQQKVSVRELFVKKSYRGEGIGKKLVKRSEKYAEERDISFVSLSVDIPNKEAYGFYKSLDFEQYRRKLAKNL